VVRGELPLSLVSHQTVIDYFRDGGIKYYNNTIQEGIEALPWNNEEQRVAFALLYVTGARATELLTLTRKDVELDGDVIRVYLTTRKNPRHPSREILVLKKVDPFYFDIIEDYVGRIRPYDAPLFPGEGNKFKTSRWLEQLVKRKWYYILSDPLKKPYLARPHLFRHTRLTHLVKFFGFREFELMQFAGWSSTKPAMVYVHLFGQDLAEKMLRQADKLGAMRTENV